MLFAAAHSRHGTRVLPSQVTCAVWRQTIGDRRLRERTLLRSAGQRPSPLHLHNQLAWFVLAGQASAHTNAQPQVQNPGVQNPTSTLTSASTSRYTDGTIETAPASRHDNVNYHTPAVHPA